MNQTQIFLSAADLCFLRDTTGSAVLTGPVQPDQDVEVLVHLSRRNVLTLLSKLDRFNAGDATFCSIIKNDTTHPKYPCSEVVMVTAVNHLPPLSTSAKVWCIADDEYYADREAGTVLPADDPSAKLH